MTNPPGYHIPQFGDSSAYVVVLFQYGVAIGAYSSDIEGCRATFAPRPPGAGYPNPATVKPVNCGVPAGSDAGRDKGLIEIIRDFAEGSDRGAPFERGPESAYPRVPADTYDPADSGKYR